MEPSTEVVERLRPSTTRRIVMSIGTVVIVLGIGFTLIAPGGSLARLGPTSQFASVMPPFADWETFTSTDGRFSASFPDQPDHSSRPDTIGAVESTTEVFVWASGGDGVRLHIAYVDFPSGSLSSISPDIGFANMERSFTTDGQTIVASRDISGGYPGHEFEVIDQGRARTFREWIAGDRVYEVGVTGESPDTKSFLDSFQITPE